MSRYDDTLQAILTRLTTGSPSLITNDNVARAHQTTVDQQHSPAVRLIDGRDQPQGKANGCTTNRQGKFTVRIMYRGDDDSVSAAAWATAQDVMDRMNPLTTPYTGNVQLSEPTITPDREVADQDLCALDMEFTMDYTTDAWSLA